MELGYNGDGVAIGQYFNAGYKSNKQRMNPKAGGRVDLKLTGDFTSGIYIESIEETENDCTIKFYSRDEKADKLTGKYKPIIWKFNENTIRQVNQLINDKIKFL